MFYHQAVKKAKKAKKVAIVRAAEAPTLEAGTPHLPAIALQPTRLCVLLALNSQPDCAHRRWHSYCERQCAQRDAAACSLLDATLADGGADGAAALDGVLQKKSTKRKVKNGAATAAEPSAVEDGSGVAGPSLKMVKSKKKAAKLQAAEADAAAAPAAADGSEADGQQGEARINGEASAVPGKEGKKKKKKTKQAETEAEPGAAAPPWSLFEPVLRERHPSRSTHCII